MLMEMSIKTQLIKGVFMSQKKRIKISKKEEEALYNDSWLYAILLATIIILMESLSSYEFSLKGTYLSYGIFLLPITFFVTNYVAKRYDYKKCVSGIAIAASLFVCFMGIISFALGKRLSITEFGGEFLAFIISQLVNLTIYLFLLNNTKSPIILIFFNYLFALIVYYMVYTLIYLDNTIYEGYWNSYFLTIGIQALLCIPLSIIDKFIKKGRIPLSE